MAHVVKKHSISSELAQKMVDAAMAKARELGIDPERIGMIGDSAGGHLSALVALAGEEPLYSSEYKSDPNASVLELKTRRDFCRPRETTHTALVIPRDR